MQRLIFGFGVTLFSIAFCVSPEITLVKEKPNLNKEENQEFSKQSGEYKIEDEDKQALLQQYWEPHSEASSLWPYNVAQGISPGSFETIRFLYDYLKFELFCVCYYL